METEIVAVVNGTNNSDLLGSATDARGFTINGLGGSDLLFGGGGSDILNGGADADMLFSGAGDDQLFGDAGNDWLEAGGGNDSLFGGTGSDQLIGGSGDDLLNGASINGTTAGEVDLLRGGNGRDTFVLGAIVGSIGQSFYTDSNVRSTGNGDYAIIQDFNSTQDRIRLAGKATDYSVGRSPLLAVGGTAIFLTKGQTTPELIAIVQGNRFTTLTGSGFEFVG